MVAVSNFRTEDYGILAASVAVGGPWGYYLGK